MRVHSQKALAEDEEASNVEDAVRCQIVDLNPIRVQQSTQEIVQWEGEPPIQEIDKTDTLTGPRLREYLFPGRARGQLIRRR